MAKESEEIGWDSHNYITMAVDRDGQLHVSGNMRNVELIYFRTETPGDISTLEKASMTGLQENRVTYPVFLTDQRGRLVYGYRDGGGIINGCQKLAFEVPRRTQPCPRRVRGDGDPARR